MAPQDNNHLHFILLPFMAQGHIIPMTDMAKQFAEHGITVTIVTTPLNALRFKTLLDRAIESNIPLRLLQLQFPCQEAGIPEGCENVDTLPSKDLVPNFLAAAGLLQKPLEEFLGETHPKPSCIISDALFLWTTEMAYKFSIPRFVFHGTSCFFRLCSHNILKYKVHESVTDDYDTFVVPDLPDHIEITRATLPAKFTKSKDLFKDVRQKIVEAEQNAYGVVMNTYYELENKYVDKYQKVKEGRVWCVGPVSLCNKEEQDQIERGNKSSIEKEQCLKWLDSSEPNSVLYVCLGSLCRLLPSQLIEIGLGLEASNVPFIWVISSGERYAQLEEWLSNEAFADRTKDRGLIIKGWAPQVLILSHQAVGGFLTHCGWNSTLEGICTGVPMITWPMFSDQFLNEKLLVDILGIGVRVGVNEAVNFGDEDKVGILATKKDVEKAIKKLMNKGEKGYERRRKVMELGKQAKRAMEEGGSSHLSITLLIEDIKNLAIKSSPAN